MSPASLGDLLAEAESATLRLIIARPPVSAISASWPSYAAAAERVLRACVGVRESNNPVDAALSRTASEARSARGRAASFPAAVDNNELMRIGELLSAAADLLFTHSSLEAGTGQGAGLRVAAIVAAAAHTVVVSERTRSTQGIALRAMRLEQVATHALEQPSRPTRLDDPRAGPVSGPPDSASVAERYQASTLAWRRIAARDSHPCDHVLRTGALSIAHVTTDLRFVLTATGIRDGVKDGVDDELRRAQERWDAAAQAWTGITTATPLPPDVRAAAENLRHNSNALRVAARSAGNRPGSAELDELLTAAVRGHRDMAALGAEQISITRRLGRAGKLYVAARDLPRDEERIEAVLRGRFVPAPSERVALLVEPQSTAVSATIRAVAAVDRALATREVSARPPQLNSLIDLAVGGQRVATRL